MLPDFRYHYGVMVRRAREGEDLEVPVPMALPDRRDNTLVAFIQRWGDEQGLAPEVAASLLYYLTKPKGSKVRERFRAHAQQEAKEKGLDLELPEDYQ
ncbi:hypothetical protein [Marinobacterium aestuariivivens]|uniref:DUF982 domain-containing protein n=1 Tax=Marinobacterium aestuariivivens TaxID=1698799 RepID=A0ABW1ZW48_9GAMM